jgi:hypothetical protein
MRLLRARVLLAAGLIAAAGTVTGVVATAGAASATSSPVVLINCAGHGKVRPAVYDIGCMPSSEYLAGLKWTSWHAVAFGSGTLKVNDCTPTCAQGKYISYPILTVLWRARPWPGHSGSDYFARLTWIFTSTRPAHARVNQTFALPSS